MASAFFNIGKSGLMNGTIDLDTHDIRIALLMTNTTADTDIDADTVSAITTLDESDDTGYGGRVALASELVTTDDTNDRGVFSASNASFTGLNGNATRAYQGVLIYKHVTNDTDSIPIVFSDFVSDIPGTATTVNIPWHGDGILYLS